MKSPILPLLSFGLVLSGLADARAQSQPLNIGVVDMQECLNQYFQTKNEVEKVNVLAREKQAVIDQMTPGFEALTTRASSLDKLVRDTMLADAKRREHAVELEKVLRERIAKGREIEEAKSAAQAAIVEARQKMEIDLVSTIRKVVDAHAASARLDLVFDKSFLPKANKVILVTSSRVPDLTVGVIAELNRSAPSGFTTATPAPAAPVPAVAVGEGN